MFALLESINPYAPICFSEFFLFLCFLDINLLIFCLEIIKNWAKQINACLMHNDNDITSFNTAVQHIIYPVSTYSYIIN